RRPVPRVGRRRPDRAGLGPVAPAEPVRPGTCGRRGTLTLGSVDPARACGGVPCKQSLYDSWMEVGGRSVLTPGGTATSGGECTGMISITFGRGTTSAMGSFRIAAAGGAGAGASPLAYGRSVADVSREGRPTPGAGDAPAPLPAGARGVSRRSPSPPSS